MVRLRHLLALGLLAAIPAPGLAQNPCDPAVNQTIGCDYHSDYGWIGRGSAPRREPAPEDHLSPEDRALLEKANKRLEQAERERKETRQLFNVIMAAKPYWTELPPKGACPPDSHASPGVNPRHSYDETRKNCASGDLDSCDALLNACTGDYVPESKYGTCSSSFDSPGRYAHYTMDDLWKLQEECEVGRRASSCSLATKVHMFGQFPGAMPQLAYHYATYSCRYGSDMDCEAVYTSCIAPKPSKSALPPRRKRHFLEGRCAFPSVSRSERKEMNGYPPETLSEAQRINLSACHSGNAAGCLAAAVGHAVLTVIPEANPDNAYYYMWLACKKDSSNCETLKTECKAAKR